MNEMGQSRLKRKQERILNFKHQRHRHKLIFNRRSMETNATKYEGNLLLTKLVSLNDLSNNCKTKYHESTIPSPKYLFISHKMKKVINLVIIISLLSLILSLCKQNFMQAASKSSNFITPAHYPTNYLKNRYFNFVSESQKQHSLLDNLTPASLTSSSSSTVQIPEIETFYIRKGANGTLPCLAISSADGSDVMNKIEWTKEDKTMVISEEKRVVVWTTKNSIAYLPETGALLFRGVTNEDSGEYTCSLTRSKTSDFVQGVVRFYVQGK